VLPLQPLALELERRGALEAWSERLAAAAPGASCALYEPDPSDARRGRCGAYAQRPSICRLFGFSGRRDKDGSTRFMTCSVLRTEAPDSVARAQALVQDGFPVALYGETAVELSGLSPDQGTRLQPINGALAEALARVGLAARYATADAVAPSADEGLPPLDRPTRPPPPRRAA
jgi:Fe-S-cluster containining protein